MVTIKMVVVDDSKSDLNLLKCYSTVIIKQQNNNLMT